MRKIPLVPVAVAMAVGIAVGHFASGIGLTVWLLLTVLSLGAVSVMSIFRRRVDTAVFLPFIALVFFSLGGLLCRLDAPRYNLQHWTARLGTGSEASPHYIVARLTSSPEPRERSWRTHAEVLQIDQRHCRGKATLFLRKDSIASSLRYGDSILIHTYIDPSKNSLYVTGDHYLVTGRDSTSLRARSEALRMRLHRRMQAGPMNPRYRGIAEALTLGWRGDLPKETQAQFRDAGILHLLCVSGLHVGLLAAIVGGLLMWVGKERRGRIVKGAVQMVAIWAFALLSGLAPATVRAAVMFSMLIVSRMMGRRTDSLNILAFAALAMLTVEPMLLFDVGWQLSFTAVTAILISRPALSLYRNFVWEAVVVSLAATVATLPITLGTFHQFQPYFLIANILITPLAALLLLFSLLYMAVPCGLTAWPADQLFYGCTWLIDGISRLPYAEVSDLNPSPLTLAMLAIGIIFAMITINMAFLRYQKTKKSTPC